MAMGALRSDRMRTALTLLGMVIGMFAIITSVTAVKVIDVYFQESLNVLGSSTFSIRTYPSIRTDEHQIRNRRPLTYEQLERLESQIRMPLTVSPEQGFALTSIRYGEQETEPNVILFGSDEDYPINYGFEVAIGRSLSPDDVQYGRSVVLLGASVAEALFINEIPLGKEIRIHGHRYRVVGVLAPKGSFLGFDWDNRVIAPITALFGRYGGSNRNIQTVSIRTSRPSEVEAAMDHVIGHMRTIRRVPPGEPNDFEIETNQSIQRVFEQFTGVLTIGGAAIGLIALLAAGVGIMNIMLVSVTERTREIGIRKAIGARRRDVMRQFLFEAFFLCQIGGLTGMAAGVLFGNLTAVYFDISAVVPVGWAVAGLLMVTGVALIFGAYPAFRASRLDPIAALRYE